jgi:hypothetical protein
MQKPAVEHEAPDKPASIREPRCSEAHQAGRLRPIRVDQSLHARFRPSGRKTAILSMRLRNSGENFRRTASPADDHSGLDEVVREGKLIKRQVVAIRIVST